MHRDGRRALLEVVKSDATSDVAVARAMAVGQRVRKVPVLCAKSCFGFIGTRAPARARRTLERRRRPPAVTRRDDGE